ncbi:PDR/VanB family oxidoreductase [Streptomyces odontomachi]|uniref:PDR/VanB family oxidoreductase n=1 Tax=Streptomyces odontomachi TaxID=2944940 RepID=UPI00210B6D39|nr:PDR/VanB family oxidoreductase [Streptomyces sp. ODS25]
MPTSPRPTPPPDLYGRDRPDRFLAGLDRFSSWYVPLATRRDRRPRPPEDDRPRELTVARRASVAPDAVALRLVAPDGGMLPRWQPGAHLDLELPSGRRRQYSLCGDPADRYAYRVAVRLVPDGGGGSAEVHRELAEGSRVAVAGPRNAFPFAREPRVLLIAGGIGVTPVLPMAREAAWHGLDWTLVHTGRTRDSLPLAEEVDTLARRHPGRVEVLADDEGGVPDAAELLARAPQGAAVYACGPAPMLDALQRAFPGSAATALHFERFTAPPLVDARPFTLRLRDGRELPVPADRSALEVLRAAEPATPYSCRQGFCGVCRLRVLSGAVDHRDHKLTDAQRAAGDMLVCVSRADDGACLELDV